MNDETQLKISGIFRRFDVDPTICEVKDEVMEDDCDGYAVNDPLEDPLATCSVKTECYKDEPDQMSENLLDKPGVLWDCLEDELSSEDIDVGEDFSDFSSGSEDYSLCGEGDGSDDSRYSGPAHRVPRLSPLLSSQSGPSSEPVAASTSPWPAQHTGHSDPSSEDEDDLRVPVRRNPILPSAASWVRVYDGEPEVVLSSEFTVKNPGPRKCPAKQSPIDYFNLLVTEVFLNLLVRETNIYARKQIEKLRRENKLALRSRLSSWVNVTLDEMKKFLSIMLLMGITHRKYLTDYWSNDVLLQYPIIKTLMPLKRFEVLSSMLHMTSRPTLSKGTPGYDPWVKIRPFLDAANKAFVRYYVPNQNLSLDESMVGMKNRNIFIQYMPKKRHARYGIKKYELVDAISMYVVQISMYSGKDFIENRPGPFTQKVVLDLLEKSKCLNKGYHVFTNNYYTGLPLAGELIDRKTFLTGTINKNSKGLPKTLVSSNCTVGEPVNYRQGKVLIVGYKEKLTRKPVFLLSTGCEADSKPVRNSHGRVSVKPVAIQSFNKFMGGVDCKDKSFYHLSCTRTAKKYWKKLFYNLLDTCIQNAYVLYSLQSEGMGSVMTRHRFILAIVRSLSGVEQPLQPSPSTSFLDTSAEHSIKPTPNRSGRLCPVCFKNAYYWCPGCNCGVHKLCFHKLEHKFRMKGSVRKPKPSRDSESD